MESVLRAPRLNAYGFAHGFSTRQGGVSVGPFESLNLGSSLGRAAGVGGDGEQRDDPSHIAENHRRFGEWVGYAPDRLFRVSQVHGAGVRVLSDADEPASVQRQEADALVAQVDAAGAGVAVGVRTADCVPLLLADPVTRAVAAVHGGWRGLVAGVVTASVEALCEASGALPARLAAAIFPHIDACCFEVGDDVAAQLQAAAPARTDVVQIVPGRKPHVALRSVVLAQLAAAGIAAERVEQVEGCTACDAARFFSFRRDGQATGRHLTVILSG